jgi:hypothetical protein
VAGANTQLNFEIFETVVNKGSGLSILYEFLSVVYLQNGCNPCYPKFIEWHNRMDIIAPPTDYTVLFVIHGEK